MVLPVDLIVHFGPLSGKKKYSLSSLAEHELFNLSFCQSTLSFPSYLQINLTLPLRYMVLWSNVLMSDHFILFSDSHWFPYDNSTLNQY